MFNNEILKSSKFDIVNKISLPLSKSIIHLLFDNFHAIPTYKISRVSNKEHNRS